MNYEISDETLVIMPYNENSSKVIEYDAERIIDYNPYEVMEYSCEYYGSSIDGRMSCSKKILGSVYKVPLLVDGYRDLVFFPTKSPVASDNIWISLNNIQSIKKISDNESMIIFKNKDKLVIELPYYVLNNQILRATRLNSVLKERREKIAKETGKIIS